MANGNAAVSIEATPNAVSIIDAGELINAIQAAQLRYWQFIERGNQEWHIETDSAPLLEKVISYLNKNQIPTRLGAQAQLILDKRITQKGDTVYKAQEGSHFKNGIFDANEYDKFTQLLSKITIRELKGHQEKAAFHASLLEKFANFSVPGSGKTSVVLAVYEKLRLEGKVDFLFVIGPASSFGPWKSEFKKTLGRKPKSLILAGLGKDSRLQEYSGRLPNDPELYLITYHTLLNDHQAIQQFLANTKCFLVLDEAHYIKRLGGEWANAALHISKNCQHKAILSGTPMPKSYGDLFNLFDFLWGDYSPLDMDSKLRIGEYEKNGNDKQALELIREKVGGLFYRVRKNDLHLLEQKYSSSVLTMNSLEAEVYRLLFTRIQELSESDYKHNFETLGRLRKARIMRLRQAVSYVPLLRSALSDEEAGLTDYEPLANLIKDYESFEKPSKVKKVIDLVKELNLQGEKVLIWSNFIGTLHFLETEISRIGISVKKIYGAVPVEKEDITQIETREKIRDEFVEGSLEVLLANPAACSESISLHTGCQHAIYYDLSYNCAQYLQSLDRIHRVGGSEEKVSYYTFLQYADSIDIDILNNVRRKAKRMEELIDMEYAIYSLDMSEEDDEELSAYDRLFKQ